MLYHGFRDYDRALTEFELAKQLLPNESRIYMIIGAIDRRTARWQEAETNFKRAVELDPRNFVVAMEAGSTFLGMRRYAEARHFYEQSFTILPHNPFARFLFGFNFFAQSGDLAAWQKQLDVGCGARSGSRPQCRIPPSRLQLGPARPERSGKGGRVDSGRRYCQ